MYQIIYLSFEHLQKNPSAIRVPEDDIGSKSHSMDHAVMLDAMNATDQNISQLCRDAGKVLFKGSNPKLLLQGEC